MRRRHLPSLLAIALVSAACEPEHDDPIFASGLAEDPTGAPLAGAEIVYERLPWDNWHSDPHERGYEAFGSTIADARGLYTIAPEYGLLQQLGPEIRLRLPTHASGTRTWVAFQMHQQDLVLPTLRQWDPQHSLTVVDGVVELSFVRAIAPEGTPATIHFVEVVDGDVLVWRQRVEGTVARIPPHVLAGTAAPEARLRVMQAGRWVSKTIWGALVRLDYEAYSETPRLPLPTLAIPALVTGVTCPESGDDACPYVDGVRALPPNPSFGPVMVALDAARRLSHVVLLNLTTPLVARWMDKAHALDVDPNAPYQPPPPQPLLDTVSLEGSVDEGEWLPLHTWTLPGMPPLVRFGGYHEVEPNESKAAWLADGRHFEATLVDSPPVDRLRVVVRDVEGGVVETVTLGELLLVEAVDE